jgi:dihydropteroate synthase
MGVINVTPDSFSDGGRYLNVERAIAHGLEMVDGGADILDIGGESSRPGAAPVGEEEETRRVLPVIEGLRPKVDVPISLDTRKPGVARRGLDAGVNILNDTSGLSEGTEMAEMADQTGAGLVIMHMRGTPQTMQTDTTYEDLIGEIKAFFETRVGLALRLGVAREQIVVDPGIGFGKSVEGNLELIRRLPDLRIPGIPLMIGPSRKSFIGKVLDRTADKRIWGTAAAVALGIAFGANIVRVHDAAEMADVVRMTNAVLKGTCGT